MVKGFIPKDLEERIKQLLGDYAIDEISCTKVEGYIGYLSRQGYDIKPYKKEFHKLMERKNAK
jgi:hypothetical protein